MKWIIGLAGRLDKLKTIPRAFCWACEGRADGHGKLQVRSIWDKSCWEGTWAGGGYHPPGRAALHGKRKTEEARAGSEQAVTSKTQN